MAQPSNREQLIDGAIQCLETKGYARTTARDITSASGANLASIGYHFGSKEALLHTALIRILEQRNRYVGRVAMTTGARNRDGNGDGRDVVERIFTAGTAVFRGSKAPRPLFVSFVEAIAEAEHAPALRQQMARHYRDARAAMAATLRDEVGGDDPETTATLLLALFDGLMLQWLLDPKAIPSGEALLAAIADLVLPATRGARR